MPDPIITLTTDFGQDDWFVGAMKGAILSRCPNARLVDITHGIARHDVRAGALALYGAVPSFPAGAIHLAVVDPGVGTSRRGLAVRAAGRFFVAPDNGLLSHVIDPSQPMVAISIDPPADLASDTFHGRDLFAPAAASLAAGEPIERLGEPASDLCLWPLPKPQPEGPSGWRGEILHADSFGNLITSFGPAMRPLLTGRQPVWRFGSHSCPGIHRTYGDVAVGQWLAYWGSLGFVEIALRQGNAAEATGLKPGDPVFLSLPEG